MKVSIIIPTYNNLNYLKISTESIKKNSAYSHEIIVHVNENKDNTINYLKNNKIKYTFSKENIGLCSSVNLAVKESTTNFILYSHDDMYFLPGWDICLESELSKISNKLFYFSGSMIQSNGAHYKLNCGDNYENFDEKYLLENYKNINIKDHQGTHWAPHLIHREIWNQVNGFSEEFNPGDGSDSDLNMKLWKTGVRLFKGLNDFKVFHFGSISMRKNKNIRKNNGTKTFLKKWGITPRFFFKHYLKTGTDFNEPLKNPKITIIYIIDLFICKIKKLFT